MRDIHPNSGYSFHFFCTFTHCNDILLVRILPISRVNTLAMDSCITIREQTRLYIGRVGDIIEQVLPKCRVVVITDANIDRLYPDLVRRYEHIIIGGGEANKSLATVATIYDRLMAMGVDRATFILGIGGGIVTDVAGFVAATYMRGLDFGFISTTLLGQVDASIGGKNGVNVADYKNMVGTIVHPRFVISDVEMLRTLPMRELRAGMAEVVKSAIIGDAELFDYIDSCATDELYHSTEQMQSIVLRAVRVKASIVEADEREAGLRRLLNLGHTIGHAVEKSTREVNHGEAVAMGLAMVAKAAAKGGMLSSYEAQRIESLLCRLGFATEPSVPLSAIMRAVRHDKKREDNLLRVVIPEAIGRCVVRKMPIEEFERLF